VLYPCVTLAPPPQPDESTMTALAGRIVFLSINRWGVVGDHHVSGSVLLPVDTVVTVRYERKKNISLAIKAFAQLPSHLRGKCVLVVAGGYDPKASEFMWRRVRPSSACRFGKTSST
jgi:hypothetical protein